MEPKEQKDNRPWQVRGMTHQQYARKVALYILEHQEKYGKCVVDWAREKVAEEEK